MFLLKEPLLANGLSTTSGLTEPAAKENFQQESSVKDRGLCGGSHLCDDAQVIAPHLCLRHGGSEPRVHWDGRSHWSTQQLGHPGNEHLSTHSISFSPPSVLEKTLLTVLPVPLTGRQSVISKLPCSQGTPR